MPDEPKNSTLAINEKSGIIDEKLCKDPPVSRDATLVLSLAEEKFIKRARQLGDAMVTLVIVKGEPLILINVGRPEFLARIS